MKKITLTIKAIPERVKQEALEKADLFTNEVGFIRIKLVQKSPDGKHIYKVEIGVKQGVL